MYLVAVLLFFRYDYGLEFVDRNSHMISTMCPPRFTKFV